MYHLLQVLGWSNVNAKTVHSTQRYVAEDAWSSVLSLSFLMSYKTQKLPSPLSSSPLSLSSLQHHHFHFPAIITFNFQLVSPSLSLCSQHNHHFHFHQYHFHFPAYHSSVGVMKTQNYPFLFPALIIITFTF